MGITVENATKRFGDFVALDEVSIEVPDGSLTALLGPSGSGKSTLLRVIAGLEEPDSGRVVISGQDMTHVSVQDRNVGFCFQHYAAFKHMTVGNNVAFGLSIRKRPKDEINERVHELLALVQLEGLIDRYPSQLSGGQRQRMALARALAVEPKVLLLDEPFGALDARVRTELRRWLRRLHDEVHVTTIFVTHDQEEAMDVAEQIVVMNDGAVEQAGQPDRPLRPSRDRVRDELRRHREPDRRARWCARTTSQIAPRPGPDSEEAMIDRIVHLGFEVRIEMTLADESPLIAQLTRAQVEELELGDGQIVYVTAEPRARVRPTAPRRGPRSWRSREPRRPCDAPWVDARAADRLLGMIVVRDHPPARRRGGRAAEKREL